MIDSPTPAESEAEFPDLEEASFPGSSMLDSASWDPATGELTIIFARGDEYTYQGVTREIWERLQAAPSAGKYFNAVIKDVYG